MRTVLWNGAWLMLVELTRAAEADVGDAAVAYELERPGLGCRFEEEVDRTPLAGPNDPVFRRNVAR
jgi:hypothetical protein